MRIAIIVYGRINKAINVYENNLDSIGREHTIDIFLSSDNSSEVELKRFIDIYKPKNTQMKR